MNEYQRNSVIALNENLDPPEHHEHSESCDCINCEEERAEYCECGAELKSDEIDYCKLCI